MSLIESRCKGGEQFDFDQDGVQWCDFVNVAVNLRVP
jgi:hypothetical protein